MSSLGLVTAGAKLGSGFPSSAGLLLSIPEVLGDRLHRWDEPARRGLFGVRREGRCPGRGALAGRARLGTGGVAVVTIWCVFWQAIVDFSKFSKTIKRT